ncbi:MAG TPA: hypothetical protein VET65_11290 [Candidatus Limnocylindrales bacterium]|nr:hypothetical protein [Candidatus Limnocylindrales bacterium]
MNLFAGLSSHQVLSVLVTVVVFTAAAGVCLLGVIGFGVRAGLMAPEASRDVPRASDAELWIFFAASMAGLVSVLAMIFLGLLGGSVFAETFLDNPLVLPVSVALILLGGLLLLVGAALAFRSVRTGRLSRSQA